MIIDQYLLIRVLIMLLLLSSYAYIFWLFYQ